MAAVFSIEDFEKIAGYYIGQALKDILSSEVPPRVREQLGEHWDSFATKVGVKCAETMASMLPKQLLADIKEFGANQLDKQIEKQKPELKRLAIEAANEILNIWEGKIHRPRIWKIPIPFSFTITAKKR